MTHIRVLVILRKHLGSFLFERLMVLAIWDVVDLTDSRSHLSYLVIGIVCEVAISAILK